MAWKSGSGALGPQKIAEGVFRLFEANNPHNGPLTATTGPRNGISQPTSTAIECTAGPVAALRARPQIKRAHAAYMAYA